jgi:hypothetical protein
MKENPMKKYHVKVAVQILEIYEVQVPDAPSAAKAWSKGRLVYIDDEARQSTVLSVEEVQP